MADGANIFIGCGGSGLKTLLRLNGFLARDREWRKRLAEDVYYILIDTDQGDLRDFQKEVQEQQCGGAMPPHIEEIVLSKGYAHLEKPVLQYFGENLKGDLDAPENRHQLHWWRNGDRGRPFTADAGLMGNLSAGAGQIPAVAFLLGWLSLPDFDRTLQRVVDEIVRRRSGQLDRPLDNAQFTIVAGLSGGTGRGCWNLFAWKLRQFMEKHTGDRVLPTAYLYDSSVMHNVMERNPKHRTAMTVNSLTGLSELSAWMNNDQGSIDARVKNSGPSAVSASGATPFDYRLPSLDKPADGSSDLIRSTEAHDKPIQCAHLIFRDSFKSLLDASNDYYDMVGTALYAFMAVSEVARRQINNATEAYRGIGAASFEVDATGIKQYLDHGMRLRTLARVSDAEANIDKVDAIDLASKEVLASAMLSIAACDEGIHEIRGDREGDLLQRALHSLMDQRSPSRNNLQAALTDDDAEAVKDELEMYTSPPTVDDVRKALAEALKSITGGNASADPMEALRNHFGEKAQAFLREHRSAYALVQFANACKARLEATKKSLAHECSSSAVDNHFGRGSHVEEYERSRGKEYMGIAGPRFNDQEQQDLVASGDRSFLAASYSKLFEEFSDVLTRLSELFDPWVEAAEAVQKRADHLKRRWETEQERDSNARGREQAFETHFTRAHDLPSGIPANTWNAQRFYRRKLKPVMSIQSMNDLLDTELAGISPLAQSELADVLEGAIFPKDTASGVGSGNAHVLSAFDKELERTIQQSAEYPNERLEEHFSIWKVVEELGSAWAHYFSTEMRGNQDMKNNMLDRFSTFFGVTPEEINNEYTVAPTKDFVLAMATSLAKTCEPYWRIQSGEHALDQSFICMEQRTDIFDNTTKESIERHFEEAGIRGSAVFGENPFSLIVTAYAGTHDLNDIQNLEPAHSDPSIRGWLEKCESPDGTSWFPVKGDNQKGFGFVDPVFVREPQLFDQRWHPWQSAEMQARSERDVLDAMLYAMLEPPEGLQSQLSETGWKLPLFVGGDRPGKKWTFNRPSLEDPAHNWEQGQRIIEDRQWWEEGDRVATGLDRVFNTLVGLGDERERENKGWRQWRDVILQEANAFWSLVAPHHGYGRDTARYRDLIQGYRQRIDGWNLQKNSDDWHLAQKLQQRLRQWDQN